MIAARNNRYRHQDQAIPVSMKAYGGHSRADIRHVIMRHAFTVSRSVRHTLQTYLVPDIEHKALKHVVALEIANKLVQELVIIGPVAVIAWPHCGAVGMIGAPDVVWENDNLGSIFP